LAANTLPFPDADRIVMVFESDLQRHTEEAIAGRPNNSAAL
jgi:hypothetical protein